MQLNDLKKKSNNYFKRLGAISPKGKNKKAIEYIIQRTYESLPKKIRKFIKDPALTLKITANRVYQAGKSGFDVRGSLVELARHSRRAAWYETKQEIWSAFKEQETTIYFRYNSYMSRNGYKSTSYWFDNVTIRQDGVLITTICELPYFADPLHRRRVKYQALEIRYDISSGVVKSAYLF